MLPCLLAGDDPDLVRLAPVGQAMDTDLWLLRHPDLRLSVRVSGDFLRERLKRGKWLGG